MQVPESRLMQLLGNAGLRRLFADHRSPGAEVLNPDDEGDEHEDGYGGLDPRRRRRPKGGAKNYPLVPSDEGRKLMDSGTFGRNGFYEDILRRRSNRLARRLMSRELGSNKNQLLRSNLLISQVQNVS